MAVEYRFIYFPNLKATGLRGAQCYCNSTFKANVVKEHLLSIECALGYIEELAKYCPPNVGSDHHWEIIAAQIINIRNAINPKPLDFTKS